MRRPRPRDAAAAQQYEDEVRGEDVEPWVSADDGDDNAESGESASIELECVVKTINSDNRICPKLPV